MKKKAEDTKDPFIESMAAQPNYAFQSLHNHLSFIFFMALVGAPMYWFSSNFMEEGVRYDNSRTEVLQGQ